MLAPRTVSRHTYHDGAKKWERAPYLTPPPSWHALSSQDLRCEIPQPAVEPHVLLDRSDAHVSASAGHWPTAGSILRAAGSPARG